MITMGDAELLEAELRAAKEELVRKGGGDECEMFDGGGSPPFMPDPDDAHLRLAALSPADLEDHIERLERDLRDLQHGIERVDQEVTSRTDREGTE